MKSEIIKTKFHIQIISYFITLMLLNLFFCQINDNFNYGNLESSNTYILDIADYLNLSLIVSSSGNIYNAAPFSTTPRATTSASLNASSACAEVNENFMLAACLTDHLLVKINFNTGDFETLLEYSEFPDIEVTSTYSSCCVSIYENTVFIAISQPSSSTDDYIRNAIIKLNILNKDDATDGPTVDTSIAKQSFIFPNEYKKTSTSRDISCEVAVQQTTNKYRLLCAYEDKGSSNKIFY